MSEQEEEEEALISLHVGLFWNGALELARLDSATHVVDIPHFHSGLSLQGSKGQLTIFC